MALSADKNEKTGSASLVGNHDADEKERQQFSIVRRAVEKTRLMVAGEMMVSTADVSSKLTAAMTEFNKGEWQVALSLAQTAAGLYQEKLNRWERLVQQKEQAIKQRSLQKFRQVQCFHNPIRTNARQIVSTFRHLIDHLSERINREAARRRYRKTESPIDSNTSLLDE